MDYVTDLSTIICDLGEADTASPRVKIEQSGCIDIVITACSGRSRSAAMRFFIGPVIDINVVLFLPSILHRFISPCTS